MGKTLRALAAEVAEAASVETSRLGSSAAASESTAAAAEPTTPRGAPRPGRAEGPVEELASDSPYNPAFDGIRGLAVAAVLLFHHGVPWMRGGYLGVSTFFTLSGFLITSLLLAERDRTGRVRLSRFWARRVRRLLPASSVTLVGVLLLAVLVDQPWERSLRGDVLGALFQVANWRFLFDDRSYGELFADPSPVLHFWSLGIEEQFYWVFPLATVAVLGLMRGSRRSYGTLLAGVIGLAAALSLALGPAHRDAVYYGTFTRTAEILAGALLAVVLFGWRHPLAALRRAGETDRPVHLAAGAATVGAGALGASVWAWWNVEQQTPALYRGGLLAYAAVSAALVGAAALSSPLQTVLGWRPLRALGRVSYGVYLFHWPLFLVLDSSRTGLAAEGWALGALRIGVTLVLASVSFHLLEQPIRAGRWPTWFPAGLRQAGRSGRWPTWVPEGVQRWAASGPALAGATVAVVALVAVLVPALSPAPLDPFEQARREIVEREAAVPGAVPRALFFGDSAALMIGGGVAAWGLDSEQLVVAGSSAQLGCGIGRGGERRQYGRSSPAADGCDWSQTWPEEIARHTDPEPRIAVVLTGVWDVVDRRVPGDDRWRGLGDPVYDQFLRDEMAAATELLQSEGLVVVWLTSPPLDFGRGADPRPPRDPADTPARVARLNELIGEVAADVSDQATGDGDVAVVDLHGYFAALSPDEDALARPDGIHVGMGTAGPVAEWLGPRILSAASEAGL